MRAEIVKAHRQYHYGRSGQKLPVLSLSYFRSHFVFCLENFIYDDSRSHICMTLKIKKDELRTNISQLSSFFYYEVTISSIFFNSSTLKLLFFKASILSFICCTLLAPIRAEVMVGFFNTQAIDI
jgi:hypothetical protein